MKIIRLSIAIIFIIFISSPSIAADGDYGLSNKAGPHSNNLISMDFQDANLKTVLKIFSQQSGLNFVASQAVQDRTVTIYFDGVTVEDALNHIMSANNLTYEQEPGSNIFIVKESGKAAVETLTKIYELKYAQLTAPSTESGTEAAAEIISVMQGVISANGKLVTNKRSNSLIITDVPSQFAVIEDVLSRLDTRMPQVMIEAEIIETSTSVADKLGVTWSGVFGAYTGPIRNTVWPLGNRFSQEGSDAAEGVGTTGTFSLSGMTATLRAILSDTDTKILARPKVLTLNNETAKIELTAETAVAATTTTTNTGSATSTTSTGAERIDTGITLEVTPQINKDGYVTMRIEPTVIVPVLSTYFKTGSTTFVDPQKRSAKTTVMVRNGETVIIGGLISKEDSFGLTKVPFFGDLPLLGPAFRYKTTDKSDKELLVFITPHIIQEEGYVLTNISEREQERPKAVREKEIRTLLDFLAESAE
jgi:type IV pilus secretin PilQ/predicted competence protein